MSVVLARVCAMTLGAVAAIAATGCGIPECNKYCEDQADCYQQDLDAAGTTWQDTYGYADREAFVDECKADYQATLDAYAGIPNYATSLNETCRLANTFDCSGG